MDKAIIAGAIIFASVVVTVLMNVNNEEMVNVQATNSVEVQAIKNS